MTIFGVDYLRLSKEDEREGESGSISNQRKIIQQYCQTHGITLVKEFVDDDYSGGNFNRPGFQDMIAFLGANSGVTTVLTKDLSRLGRDMSESSFYAERYFPERGIHYLAIDDSFDSEKENMLAPFQFAMNDMYIRDVSKKVKNALHVMMDHGEYCFGAPYGYKKDPNDMHHLVPDEKTAPVVTDIFSMASAGESAVAIAKQLTAKGVLPPLQYRVDYREGPSSGNTKYATHRWNSTTVRRILNNPVYLGHTVLGKSKKVSPKSEVKRRLPKEQWRVTENTHEALVDEVTKAMASKNLASRSRDYRAYDHVRKSIFGGIAYCATCGAAMCSSGSVYKGEREKYWYLSCQNIPARSKHRCEDGARIKYETLLSVVMQDLRAVISLTPEQKKEMVDRLVARERSGSKAKEIEKKAEAVNARIATVESAVTKLYDDMYTDVIPRDRALSLIQKYEQELSGLKLEAETYKQTADTTHLRDSYEKFFRLVDEVSKFETLDRSVLSKLIEKIEIYPKRFDDGKPHGARSKAPFTQEVKIYYKFIGLGDFA